MLSSSERCKISIFYIGFSSCGKNVSKVVPLISDEWSNALSEEPGIEIISITQLNIKLFWKILPHLMTPISQHKKHNNKTRDSYLGLPDNRWEYKTIIFKELEVWELIYISSKCYCISMPGPLAVKLFQAATKGSSLSTKCHGNEWKRKLSCFAQIWLYNGHFQFIHTWGWAPTHTAYDLV